MPQTWPCCLTQIELSTLIHLVHLDLCDVASLHSHTPPALCSLVMAQQFHLQETYRATFPPSQNWPNLYQEERDATRQDYLMKNNKTNVLCNISTLGRVSMMIVLVYFLCHTPKLCLSFFEITFKDTKVSNSNAIKIHNTKQSIFLQPLICIF